MNKILEETLAQEKADPASNSVCWLVFAVAFLNEADLLENCSSI